MRIIKKDYRYVFLVQNRNYWKVCPFKYEKEKDLVLSFDFAVVNMVRLSGGEAQYIDHIVSSEMMEKYNYEVYRFFETWNCNSKKEDIFIYRGVDVGSTFRIAIWNDVTFHVRLFINLHEFFKKIQYELIYEGISDPTATNIMHFLGVKTIKWSAHGAQNFVEYSFPIFRLFDESLHPPGIRYKARVFLVRLIDKIFSMIERIKSGARVESYVYIECYNPTQDIIFELRKQGNIKMVRNDFNGIRDIFNGVHLPVFISANNHHRHVAKEMIERFYKERCTTLSIDNMDISDDLNKIIIKRISPLIAKSLAIVDVVMDFFAKRKLSLMITFSSIGIINRLMVNYCKIKNIPVYMIINGFLANSFLDEAKDGTWINSYGESIRANYFKGMSNIVCLGDPRMDKYSVCSKKKWSACSKLTIGIGTSLFSNVDLNSYLAVEFEFLNDIMNVCRKLRDSGKEIDVVIKLRQNNYIEQYSKFLDEYYSDIPAVLFQNIQMMKVYQKVDLYISLASQTLFEASCLGIPVLYYKNDTHYYHAPFDGNSELVTAHTPDDLFAKIEAFYCGDRIYDAFIERKVLEKYIGPLDGKNLERNMDFIYSLCQK